jgi:archaellum component FlaC
MNELNRYDELREQYEAEAERADRERRLVAAAEAQAKALEQIAKRLNDIDNTLNKLVDLSPPRWIER